MRIAQSSRCPVLALAAVTLIVFGCAQEGGGPASAAELTLPDTAQTVRYDFEGGGDGWTVVTGRWAVEDMAVAPSGQRVLVQRATDNDFDVIVAPAGPLTAFDDLAIRGVPADGRG